MQDWPTDLRWLRIVLDEAPDGMVIEEDARIVYMNHRYAQLLGYRRDDVVGARIAEVIAGHDLARLLDYGRRRSRRAVAPMQYRFDALGRGGRIVTLDASVSSVDLRGRTLIVTTVRDAIVIPAPECASFGDMESEGLSPREIEVLRMILDGRKLTDIARDLGIHAKTVSTHRFRLFAKLHVKTTRDLFELAARRRLIDWKG